MRTTREFYIARAAEARADAAGADLPEVRDRNLRSAAAWDVMAARALRTDRMRAEQEARKIGTVVDA